MDVDCICKSSQVPSPRKMREDNVCWSIDWTVIKVAADVCNSNGLRHYDDKQLT